MSCDALQKLSDKLAALDQRKAALQRRVRTLESENDQRARKNDTRRKIITGGLALKHASKNRDSGFTKKLLALLNEYITRAQDRQLMSSYLEQVGLPALPPLLRAPKGHLRMQFQKSARAPRSRKSRRSGPQSD